MNRLMIESIVAGFFITAGLIGALVGLVLLAVHAPAVLGIIIGFSFLWIIFSYIYYSENKQ